MMQLLAGAGPGQGQLFPGESWSRPRLWPNSWAMEEATPRMLVEWSWGEWCPRSSTSPTALLSPALTSGAPAGPASLLVASRTAEPRPGVLLSCVPSLTVWPWEISSVLGASAVPPTREELLGEDWPSVRVP